MIAISMAATRWWQYMLASVLAVTVGGIAQAQEIWLGPAAHMKDLLDMFRPNAPWAGAAAHVNVFKLYGNPFIVPTPQPDIDLMVADLNRRGIAIAVETGVMNVSAKPRPACGGWGLVEGYGPIAMHEEIARKIKRAGGTIKFIAMDEPLFYGHYFAGRPGGQPGCRASIPEVARLIAPSLAVYIREFPGVMIGDVEPSGIVGAAPGNGPTTGWQHDYEQWAQAFRDQIGRPIAFLQIDAAWKERGAEEHTVALFNAARAWAGDKLIGKVGMIYNGDPTDQSNLAWVGSAQRHMTIVESNYGLRPDQVVIQTWHRFPERNLPESSDGTLTNLVDRYVKHQW